MKKMLLRKIPLMTSLCVLVNAVYPSQELAASPEYSDHFQQQIPLRNLLKVISDHYKVNILFEDGLIQNKTSAYRFEPNATSLDKALYEILTPLGLKASRVDANNYAVIPLPKKDVPVKTEKPGEKVVVMPPSAGNTVLETNTVTSSLPEQLTIRGRVLSTENEQPVQGASVVAKGTKIGTTTDAEGYFVIKIPRENRILTFGHVNYTIKDVLYDGSGNVSVRLTPKEKELGEVIVTTGLFKRSKDNFTGAATTVTGDQLRQVNSMNALEAIRIFEPAIRIPDNVQFGSDPNRLPNVTLRGTNNFPQQTTEAPSPTSGADFMSNYSNNPNQPLFILDGFEVSLQKIYDLDINRIATFTVLKDAAATSIYGSRAANGVIVIDTKQPLAGKLRVSYTGTLQIAAPDLTVYDLTDAAEKLEVERLAGIYSQYASGIRPDADAVLRQRYANRLAAVQKGVNTYWLSKPVQTGIGTRQSLYLEGGDNFIRYGIDLGYYNNAGVMKNSNRSTYTGGMNFSYRYKGFLFKNVLSVAFNKGVNSNYGSFSDYARQNPYWNPYDENGNVVKVMETIIDPVTPSSTTSYVNPLFNTTLNTTDESKYTNITNQTNLEWLIGKGFRLTGRLQIIKQNDQSDKFLPAQHTSFNNITDITRKGSYTKGSGDFFSYDGTIQLDYSKQFGKSQLLNSSGASLSETNSNYMTVKVEGFPNDRLSEISFGNGFPLNSKPTYSASVSRLASAYTNFNYSFDNRYNADMSIRTDGSSQFGSKKRFGTFWSAGASWNLHREKFMADKRYINQFRVRGSVGTTGDNKFQPFMGITTYNYYTDQNYRGQTGAILAGFGNENLQWQQTLKKNLGIDLAVLRNRISISFDIYRENTSNLILDITTPPSVGYGSYKENVGELQNDGYEFKLNAFVMRNESKGFYWSVYANGLHNKDFIKKISNSLSKLNQTNDANSTSTSSPDYNKQTKPQFRFEEGQSVNTIWAVRSAGIDPSTGREVYFKKDGTLTYTWSAADKVVVGNTIPELRGSFGTSVGWKGFTLGVYFIYEYGADSYNQTLLDRVEVTNFTYNVDRRVLYGRWKKPGDITYFKGLVDENNQTVNTVTNATSRFVQENNYISAESISLGYVLPVKVGKKLGLNNTRFTFIANDLQRWSSIEVERGLDYPFSRNFTFTISTSF